jgi:hypothetical protein
MNTRFEATADHARPTDPGYGTNVGKKDDGEMEKNRTPSFLV